jgi:hypothetical protein
MAKRDFAFDDDEDAFECKDVDECEEGLHNCTSVGQECDNIDGGYKCGCVKGFELNGDTGNCDDIDECHNISSCNSSTSTCNNTIGSFDCACKSGYEKTTIGSCTDIDECTLNMCKNNTRCLNREGHFECQCLPGFVRKDNHTCFSDGKERACNGLKLSNGSCVCPEGFIMNMMDDRYDCHDIDECITGGEEVHKCPEDKACVNTFGGHECMDVTCPDDYVRVEGRRNWCRHTNLDERCLNEGVNCKKTFVDAATISYNFATVHNNPTITSPVTLYELWGLPAGDNPDIKLEFHNNMVNISSGNTYELAEYVRDFKFDYDRNNGRTTVELLRSLKGPQHIQIRIDAESTQMPPESKLIHIAYLNVYVSKYNDHFK